MKGNENDEPALADISALLAGARVTEPVPDEVVARLDATLAELTAGRRAAASEPADGPEVVVPLRRRRVTVRRLLAAAAAVVVLGGGAVGLTKVLGSDSTLAGSARPATVDNATGAKVVPSPAAPEAAAGGSSSVDGLSALVGGTVPQFRTASFDRDAATFLSVERNLTLSQAQGNNMSPATGDLPAPTAPTALPAQPERSPASPPAMKDLHDAFGSQDTRGNTGTGTTKDTTRTGKSSCPGPANPDGTTTPIDLDGKPAVLVVHPAVKGWSLVEAWSCDGSEVLASASVAR